MEKPMNYKDFYKELNEDKIPDGKGDNKPDSDFNEKELAAGIKTEKEHTGDESLAKEIAKDHLTEDPRYYSKLKAAGLADELKENDDKEKCEKCGTEVQGTKLCLQCSPEGSLFKMDREPREPRSRDQNTDETFDECAIFSIGLNKPCQQQSTLKSSDLGKGGTPLKSTSLGSNLSTDNHGGKIEQTPDLSKTSPMTDTKKPNSTGNMGNAVKSEMPMVGLTVLAKNIMAEGEYNKKIKISKEDADKMYADYLKRTKMRKPVTLKDFLDANQYTINESGLNVLTKKNEIKTNLSVPEQHQKKIAIQTLKMADAAAHVMGGMDKTEARNFLRKLGYSDNYISKIEGTQSTSSGNGSNQQIVTDPDYFKDELEEGGLKNTTKEEFRKRMFEYAEKAKQGLEELKEKFRTEYGYDV